MRTFIEFENAAKFSKYPFSESCSLSDDGGRVLSPGFLLDAFICLRASAPPELSSLSKGRGVFSSGTEEVAWFEYSGPGSVPVFDMVTSEEVGMVLLGPDATGIEEFVFFDSAAALCPACFCLFPAKKHVTSVSAGYVGGKLLGLARLCGANGVYVTKQVADDGVLQLRIDIIGYPDTNESCCPAPIRNVFIWADGCPVIAPAALSYPEFDPLAPSEIIPGVIALRSALSADAVCGSQEKYVQPDGSIGTRYCDPKLPPTEEPEPCISTPLQLIQPAGGNIDLVPYSAPGEGGSPVEVSIVHNGMAVASYVANLSDPSMKNLAIMANSGTVVLQMKGSS